MALPTVSHGTEFRMHDQLCALKAGRKRKGQRQIHYSWTCTEVYFIWKPWSKASNLSKQARKKQTPKRNVHAAYTGDTVTVLWFIIIAIDQKMHMHLIWLRLEYRMHIHPRSWDDRLKMLLLLPAAKSWQARSHIKPWWSQIGSLTR